MDQRTGGNCRPPGVPALVGQELDAGWCSGPILNFLTTFQYLVLDFVSTFHYLRPDISSTSPLLFSSLVSVVPEFLEEVDDFSGFSGGKL